MSTSEASPQDDPITVIAVSALACILQDVLHEGLGHGVTAGLSGARQVTVSTVALQSDIETRWVSANGTLVNLFFAAIFWFLLLRTQRYNRPYAIFSFLPWRAISSRVQDIFSFPALPISATVQR